ncbi:MAG: NusG domain II-containing protein [Firmicutes bacterium]|nr:NusG domain II-containing protein [Bacillota bacterium]
MKWKKGDLVVVVAVLLMALSLFAVKALPAAAGERVLQVTLDGQLVKELALTGEHNETITVPIPKGEAVVEIIDGKVRMLPMSKELCPQAICSHVGWIERPGDAIVCLPNRLIVTIEGNGTTVEELDGKTQ